MLYQRFSTKEIRKVFRHQTLKKFKLKLSNQHISSIYLKKGLSNQTNIIQTFEKSECPTGKYVKGHIHESHKLIGQT